MRIRLTKDEIFRISTDIFKCDIKKFKMNLIEYANLRSKGIMDPSYVDLLNHDKKITRSIYKKSIRK